MKKQEYEQLLQLPPQEYCNKVCELFPRNTEYAYATDKPFAECEPDEIVYVPEKGFDDLPLDFTYYTKQDLLDLCNGCEELAEYIFESLEWQYPETYLEELCNNFTDIVIDYNFTKVATSPIAKTLYEMLSVEEQAQVLREVVRYEVNKTIKRIEELRKQNT